MAFTVLFNDAQEPCVRYSLGFFFLWESDPQGVNPHKKGTIASGLCPDQGSDPLGGRAVGRECIGYIFRWILLFTPALSCDPKGCAYLVEICIHSAEASWLIACG